MELLSGPIRISGKGIAEETGQLLRISRNGNRGLSKTHGENFLIWRLGEVPRNRG